MRFTLLFLLFLPLISLCQLTGRVVGITDGDTFTLLDSTKIQIKIRLHGIDCPEKGQPFSNICKKRLTELIYLKRVLIYTSGKDRYGRTLGIVMFNNAVINETMLAEGMAWHYTRYDKRQKWARLEKIARSKRLGLWNDDNPIPPWEWRRIKKKS